MKIALTFLSLLAIQLVYSQSVVTVEEINGQWELLLDGEPYYINGAGGEKHLDQLVACGGNTIRTWGIENAQEVLDQAHAKGIKVMLGLWVQHERHGFDYNNEAKVRSQLENFKKQVKKYKDHPALLIWCVGNEYELNYSNTKVWSAVNDIAKMIQAEDTNHPVATVTAGTNAEKLGYVMSTLTDIDIYGINTYGDIKNVNNVLSKGNFKGPYMITEWGPTGHWEIDKTMWNSSIEQTSTQKSASYKKRFKEYIKDQRKQCIGSFAFLWGQKQEYTSTWYGLFAENNMPTEAIDELQFAWSGAYPENRCPSIDSLSANGTCKTRNLIVNSNDKIAFEVFASDKNNDKLQYSWELYPESTDLKTGGDAENKPPMITGSIKNRRSNSITVKAPNTEGRYRIFVFVTDGNRMAYANIPFYVEYSGDNNNVRFKKQPLESFQY